MTSARRIRTVATAAVVLIAVATRLAPLWWSPLPATLDGFVYVRTARETLQAGEILLDGFGADFFGSTLLTTAASAATGIDPLYLVQPLYAGIGATTVLLGVTIVRRVGQEHGWPQSQITQASVLAGLILAVEGVFVRRTGIPDDDALMLLVVPLIAVAYYQYLQTSHARWLIVLCPLLVITPLTQTLAALVTGLVLLAISAAVWIRRTDTPVVKASLIVASYWIFVIGYYQVVAAGVLSTQYVSRVATVPGLFAAWVIVTALGTMWFFTTSSRMRRLATGLPLIGFLALVLVNAERTLFPGTAMTPQIVAFLIIPLLIPIAYAVWASGTNTATSQGGVVLIGLAAAPIALILFGLSASLSPEYSALVTRVQLHLHLPVIVLAAVAAVRAAAGESFQSKRGGNAVRVVAVGLLVVAALTTTPLAYMNLDTGSIPSTTLQSEYEAGSFAATYLTEPWTSSHTQVRIARAPRTGVNGTIQPTRVWLRGGPAPECPVILQRSWTTTGAHLYPSAPEQLPDRMYNQWIRNTSIVYTADGNDPITVTVPDQPNQC